MSNEQKRVREQQTKRRGGVGIIRTIALSLLVVVLLLVGSLSYLIYSPQGLQILVNRINHHLSEYVTIGEADGRLGDEFILRDGVIQISEDQIISFDHFSLSWHPLSLFKRELTINQLSLHGFMVDYLVAEGEKREQVGDGALDLAEFSLPLKVTIDKIDIEEGMITLNQELVIALNHLHSAPIVIDYTRSTLEMVDLEGVLVMHELAIPLQSRLDGALSFKDNWVDLNLTNHSDKMELRHHLLNTAFNINLSGPLDQLQLTLRSRTDWNNLFTDPVIGNLDLSLSEQSAVALLLTLKNVDNHVTLKGEWDSNNLFDVMALLHLDAPNLTQIHPDLHGIIQGSLSVEGSLLNPLVESDLKASHLALGSLFRLDNLDLYAHHNQEQMIEARLLVDHLKAGEMSIDQIKLDSLGDIKSSLVSDLTIQRVKSGEGTLLTSLHNHIEGAIEDHRFNIVLDSPYGEFNFGGIGRLVGLNSDPKWTLYLDESEVTIPQLGVFTLQKPTYLFASKEEVSLSSFCLNNLPTTLCLEGRYDEEMSVGTAVLRRLPADIITQYLPEEITVNTALDVVLSGRFSTPEDYVGVVDISLAKGDTAYQLQGRQIKIPLTASFMRILANAEKVESEVKLDWGDYLQIEGVGNLDDPFATAIVQYHAEAHIPSLNWIAPLFPEIQELRGNFNARADIHGPITRPNLYANVGLTDGHLYLPELNSRLENIYLRATLKEGLPELVIQGRTRLGEGNLDISGNFNIANLSALVTAKGDNLTLADAPDIKVNLSSDITYRLQNRGQSITGTIDIPSLLYRHSSYGESRGPVRAISPDAVIVAGGTEEKEEPLIDNMALDLRVILRDDISVGMGSFLGRLKGFIKIEKEFHRELQAFGGIDVEGGEYQIYGQRLNLDRGQVRFAGPLLNPLLDIQASRELPMGAGNRKGNVGINLTGNLRRPKIALYSNPMMPDLAIVSYLLLGREPNLNSPADSAFLAKALYDILSGNDPGGAGMADQFGLTDLGLTQDLTGNAAVGMGKQVNDHLYMGVGVSLTEESNAYGILRYSFLKYFNFETQLGSEDSSIDILYKRDF